MTATDPDPSAAPAAVRFAALRCDLDEALQRGELTADSWCVLSWMVLQAKVRGDTGIVWISAPHVRQALRGMKHDKVKGVLRDLQRRGFIKSLRAAGSRGKYPTAIDRYVLFDTHGEMHLVSAAATTDWRAPVTTRCTSKRSLAAPRTAPPCSEAEERTRTEQHPSDAGASAPDGKASGAGEQPSGPPVTAADTIADLWAALCPTLAQPVRPLAKGVRQALTTAARREGERGWKATFTRVAASSFLSGRKTDFRASLIWVVGPTNLAKLDTGAYDDAPGGAAPRANSRQADLFATADRVLKKRLADKEAVNPTEEVHDGI